MQCASIAKGLAVSIAAAGVTGLLITVAYVFPSASTSEGRATGAAAGTPAELQSPQLSPPALEPALRALDGVVHHG